jgi:hypothetical protein
MFGHYPVMAITGTGINPPVPIHEILKEII